MPIEWFKVEPGSDIGINEEENTLLFGADTPDWIKVPDHPGLPGGQRRVLKLVALPCVRPGHDHRSRHYLLEGPVSVCECPIDNVFQWYERKNDDEPDTAKG